MYKHYQNRKVTNKQMTKAKRCPNTRKELVLSALTIVYSVYLRHYQQRYPQIPEEDFIQEGILGIYKAIGHFDLKFQGGRKPVSATNFIYTVVRTRMLNYGSRVQRWTRPQLLGELFFEGTQIDGKLPLTKFVPPTRHYHCSQEGCQNLSAYHTRKRRQCLRHGFCATHERAYFRAKAKFGVGRHACGTVIRSRNRRPWCPSCKEFLLLPPHSPSG